MTAGWKTGVCGVSEAFTDLDAERAVIGAALMDHDAARQVAELSNGTFTDPVHRTAHAAIKHLVSEDKAVDAMTVRAKARENGADIDDIYLIECSDQCPVVGNVKHYIDILAKCASRRQLDRLAKELMRRAGDPTVEPNEAREWGAHEIRMVKSGESDRLISMSEAAGETFKQLNAAMKGENRGIKSGIGPLDSLLGGFKAGEMVVVGARPSVGKSILALTFCVNAARQGKRVLLVSLEMNEVEITERILANSASIPLNEMVNATMTSESIVNLGKGFGEVSRLPIWYCLEATTVERIRKAAYRLYEDGGLDMIAVDYMQLMEATYSKGQSRQEQISEISRGLRKLSMELNIPVIVLSQLNRSSEGYSKDGKGTRREPTMSEARESGAIEQDANIFLLLHNPRRDEMATEDEARMWDMMKERGMTLIRLIVDKNRQGKRGRILVAFDGEHMRFLPIDRRE